MALRLTGQAINLTGLRYQPDLLPPSSSRFSKPPLTRPIKAIQSGGDEAASAGAASAVATPTRAPSLRRPHNVDGEFFVDTRCIDCDTCRWMAPQIFTRVEGMSAVSKQPTSSEERLNALQALLACPTSSIHTEKPTRDVLEAQKTFPLPIDDNKIPGIYHCGYHSEKSYGAASYLIIRPDGNIIVDSPRFTEKLARNIEALGGANYMFLTHMDDVADHEKWSKRLNCQRILHSGDVPVHFHSVRVDTADVEIKLEGNGPWSLGEDVELIHVPGHTEDLVVSLPLISAPYPVDMRGILYYYLTLKLMNVTPVHNKQGSVCLFYKPHKILFAGDHLGMTEFGLSIFETYNRISVPMQLDSVKKLLKLNFQWILPGHGRRAEYKDSQEKDSALESFVQQKCSQYTT
ncbi:unnamed protein product [Linum tenue]|uniref:Metallo-beta-lactamase domain-containing protein n=1 Tax=Linum tenue TaxID=586396 RepID=A0AAV0S8G7_9ROSI|nr:unnamed protein product [Linum tenue]